MCHFYISLMKCQSYLYVNRNVKFYSNKCQFNYFKGLTDGCLPAVFCSSITMSYFVAMKSEKLELGSHSQSPTVR